MSRKTGRRRPLFGGRNKGQENQGLLYRVRDDYLSPVQISFLKMMLSAVGDTFIIIPRVNLSEIFFMAEPEDNRNFHKSIDRQRIDFLLCDRDTMQPLAGLELSEHSNQLEKPPEQEIYVDDIFEAAKLPLVRIFVAAPLNPEDLRERLLEVVGEEGKKRTLENQMRPDNELHGDSGGDKAVETLPVLTESPLQIEETLKELELQIEEPLRDSLLKPEEPLQSPTVEEEEPVQEPVPPEAAGRRFLNSQTEQTPGVDFFTGSISEVGPPPAAGTDSGLTDTEPGEPAAGELVSDSQPLPEHVEPVPGLSRPGELSADVLSDAALSAGGSQTETVPDMSIQEVGALAGLPSGLFDLKQLKERLKQEAEQAAQEALQSGAPACPRCNATMILRTSKRGHQFYVCANYPYCREVRGLYE
jgi:hypothetical protein